jgi:hypothetical protein
LEVEGVGFDSGWRIFKLEMDIKRPDWLDLEHIRNSGSKVIPKMWTRSSRLKKIMAGPAAAAAA